MALEYLKHSPTQAFRKLERDILLVNPEVNMRRFKAMTPRALGEEITKLEDARRSFMAEHTYGSWLASENYMENRLLKEALEFLKEHKEGRKADEVLVPGFTYYRGVKQFGDDLVGHRCYFREGTEPMWVPFRMNANMAKAFEVLRHGSEEDFKRIYIEMADGRLDSLQKLCLEHITESSPSALSDIGAFCDDRWDGPWAWETTSPYTLRESIEERREMLTVNEMQAKFEDLLVRLNEDEMDKYAVIAAAEEMSSTIEKMVQQIARLGGEGIITLKDQIRVTMGDDAAAQIEDKFLDPVRNAADALSQLRAIIEQTVTKLKSGDTGGDVTLGEPATPAAMGADPAADPMADPMGGDMGSPEDAMGADPLADPEDALAGADLEAGDEERPMKGM